MARQLVSLPLQQPPRVDQAAVNLLNRRDDRVYHLADRWSLHLLNWSGSYELDGRAWKVAPGTAVLIPARCAHRLITPERAETLYVQFTPRGGPPGTELPQVSAMPQGGAAMWLALHDLIGWHAEHPTRASARLWEVLWSMQPGPVRRRHPLIEQACELIRWRLAEPLSVAWLAHRLGVPHNRLTRLFRAELRCTVVGHIRELRLEQARFLLAGGGMPIGEVARAAGFSDARYLARLIRRRFGTTPSGIRRQSPATCPAGDPPEPL
jgi:AraC-like DNA-binding protein